MQYESLTYKEIAERFGMKVISAQRLVLKKNWSKHTGNDGIAKVQVPIELIPAPKPAPAPAPTEKVTVLNAQIKGLKETVEAMKTAVEGHQARADTAEARVADLIQERDRRAALEARSWVKRMFG